MKNIKSLTIIAIGILLVQCNGIFNKEEKIFSFSPKGLKKEYTIAEKLLVNIDNLQNKPIDSIIFYANSKKINNISTQKEQLIWNLKDEKLGDITLKAIVYSEGKEHVCTAALTIFADKEPTLLAYEIVNEFPHDIKAYTQGLEFFGDELIESTGNGQGASGEKGVSSIRKVNFSSGKVTQISTQPASVFGEGATKIGNQIYQLTWLNNQAIVYDYANLKEIKRINYPQKMEGWGLCFDGENLLMTDSGSTIWFLNPENLSVKNQITAATNSSKIEALNELEWVNDVVFANIYQKDAIVKINPKNGAVLAAIDLSALKNKVTQHIDIDVLNGIAYHKTRKTFFVTGKNWDKIFEIKIKE